MEKKFHLEISKQRLVCYKKKRSIYRRYTFSIRQTFHVWLCSMLKNSCIQNPNSEHPVLRTAGPEKVLLRRLRILGGRRRPVTINKLLSPCLVPVKRSLESFLLYVSVGIILFLLPKENPRSAPLVDISE